MSTSTVSVHHRSPVADKIALFRSLFRGREEVFSRRFESRKTGHAGYQPACANEWIRGVCEKPKVKCSACPQRRFLPVTDEVVRQHLSGQDSDGRPMVIGVYPMLQDETCFFLAIDFDKATWVEDVAFVEKTCRKLNLPIAIERSRSGNGAHVWLFFAEAIPATLARKLGSHILTETMDQRPDIGLDSYDRLFPNQDTLPQGGFGNLIALPLQKQPRELGNSVFIFQQNGHWQPYPDQWAFLSTILKIERNAVEMAVHEAEATGRVVGVRLAMTDEDDDAPWLSPPSRRHTRSPLVESLPKTIEAVLGDQVYIAKESLPAGLRNQLLRIAAFQNPEFYKAQTMRLPTYGKPRVIGCAEDFPTHIGLPRGCWEDIRLLLADLHINAIVRDERIVGAPLDVTFHGELRPEQRLAAESMLAHDTGILAATTAFGKTVVAAWMIAQRRVSALVLVHRRQLLEQWVERLATFLGLPPKSIGKIGGGRRKATGLLDVAVIQSLVRKGVVNDCVGQYGQVLVDECHHLSASSFEQVVRRAKAKYVLGLSATVTRKDGHHPIVFMQCGPVRHSVDAKAHAIARPFEHVIHVRPTPFFPTKAADENVRRQFHDLYEDLIADDARNRFICDDVTKAIQENRSPLVLTERNEHLDRLAKLLSPNVKHLIVLRGGMGKKSIRDVADRLAGIPDHESRVLLATGRYVGEGFDDARLDTLFLTLPVSWRGTIAQYVGRLHRLHESKREVRVYDYADLNVPMLARMFDRRCRGYEAVGYTILLPGSAVPGWPADVPLPVDSQWKSDYAASVRRLVRDGVDRPLAKLFVHATCNVTPNAEGVERARSASEAFLYHRLETLPETAGRFRLNTQLSIPFDGWGQMEVDLLCADARVAIEIDGPQHFDSAEAYRRDRRKDQLLQENGYFVLRFLAEDVGKNLDLVLNTILRTLTHCRQEILGNA